MASFTNFATLSYNGGTTNSNTVTGELLEVTVVSLLLLSFGQLKSFSERMFL